MKYISGIILLLMLSACLIAQTAVAPSIGDGSSSNPYRIASLGNLYWIAASDDVVPAPDQISRWSSHYIQTANINASDTQNWFQGLGWSPIGYFTSPYNYKYFTGSYNGQGYSITGLYLFRLTMGYLGLFGAVEGAVIENLSLTNADITGRNLVGGLAGQIMGNSFISNCHITGNVSGIITFIGGLVGISTSSTINNSSSSGLVIGNSNYVGGLVGSNTGSIISNSNSSGNVIGLEIIGGLVGRNNESALISNSYSSATIYGDGRIGGLVGLNESSSTIDSGYSSGYVEASGCSDCGISTAGGLLGTNTNNSLVTNSYSSASVSGDGRTGGLVGENSYTSIVSNSSASGAVTSTNQYTGGLVGYNTTSLIENSFSMSSVTGTGLVGGLAGMSQGPGSTIANSYSSGNVTGDTKVGGLVGESGLVSIITNSFSTGSVNGTTSSGGLVGVFSGDSVTNSYWNTQTSGMDTSAAGEGRTTSAMTYPYATNTYINWDFVDIWGADANFEINNGYPYLFWQSDYVNPDPNTAANPLPADGTIDIPLTMEEISWTYVTQPGFADPLGFRVYMNTTGNFGAGDPFVWVAYLENQSEYSNSSIIPVLEYETTYYWTVIPTTEDPTVMRTIERSRATRRDSGNEHNYNNRGDAQNCPVWSFTTIEQVFPPSAPTIAHSPLPEDEAIDVPLYTSLGWTYTSEDGFSDPDRFLVNMWIGDQSGDPIQGDFEGGTGEYLFTHLQHSFQFICDETYLWQVVPYVVYNNENIYAENCPIWSFNTAQEDLPPPSPTITHSPIPADGSIDVPLHTPIGWTYTTEDNFSDPDFFLVNMWVGDQSGDPVEVVFDGGAGAYLFSDHPFGFICEETYFWQVIPYVVYNDENIYAEDCPIWTFVTAEEDFPPPAPAIAHTPIPENGATNIQIDTPLGWTYTSEDGYSNPVGYLVNMWSGAIDDDPYQTVIEGGVGVYYFEHHPFEFDYDMDYFWQVIPFITYNDENIYAEDCPVWRFKTAIHTSSDDIGSPQITELKGNYPNPFNPMTTINYSVSFDTARLDLKIYNVKGQLVRTLHSGYHHKGNYQIVWDGKSDHGSSVSSGVYFYRMTTPDYDKINKMMMVK